MIRLIQFPAPPMLIDYPCHVRNSIIVSIVAGMIIGQETEGENLMRHPLDSFRLGLSELPTVVMEHGISSLIPAKGAISASANMTTLYDSNFFLSENHPQDELIGILSPKINYLTDPEGAAPISLFADYEARARFYQENTELDGVDHQGALKAKIEGSKTVVAADAQYQSISSTDSLTGKFITSNLEREKILATYQAAPKTSIYLGATRDSSTYDSKDFVPYSIYSAHVGFFWAADERLSFGPSFNYSSMRSGTIGTRDTETLSLKSRYSVSEKIELHASLGIDHAVNQQASGNRHDSITGNLAASYRLDPRWTLDAMIQRQTTPSASQKNYLVNESLIFTNITRNFATCSASMGLLFDLLGYDRLSTFENQLMHDKRIAIFIDFKKPIFNSRADVRAGAQFSINDGNTEWRQTQLSAAFNLKF